MPEPPSGATSAGPSSGPIDPTTDPIDAMNPVPPLEANIQEPV